MIENVNSRRKDMKRYLLLICLLLNACSNLPLAIKNPPLYDISYTASNPEH